MKQNIILRQSFISFLDQISIFFVTQEGPRVFGRRSELKIAADW